jgi:hypothetical protein
LHAARTPPPRREKTYEHTTHLDGSGCYRGRIQRWRGGAVDDFGGAPSTKQGRHRDRLRAARRSADQQSNCRYESWYVCRREAEHLERTFIGVVDGQSIHADWRHDRWQRKRHDEQQVTRRRHVHARRADGRVAATCEPSGRDHRTRLVLVQLLGKLLVQCQWPAVERPVRPDDLGELRAVRGSESRGLMFDVRGSWNVQAACSSGLRSSPSGGDTVSVMWRS